MTATISINPFRCRMWEFHDRLESQLTEQTCKVEIESISRHGQLVPALGRRIANDPAHEVELIYGARRLFVARHLNKDLLVEVRPISDREAIVAMDIENRLRKDISPYERGLSYARWLQGGLFSSQEDVARALRISTSQVSRLLKLAHLPRVVLDAFQNPGDVCEAWGLELATALNDTRKRASILRKARELADSQSRRQPRDVFQHLRQASGLRRRGVARSRDEVIKDRLGRPLFRVRRLRNCYALIVPLERAPSVALERMATVISTILLDATSQPADLQPVVSLIGKCSAAPAALPSARLEQGRESHP